MSEAAFVIPQDLWERGTFISKRHYRKRIERVDKRVFPHPLTAENFEPLDPYSVLQSLFCRYLPERGRTVRILDIGAGPWTTINKTHPAMVIMIDPIDALADHYNKLLDKNGILVPVPTVQMFAKDIVHKYDENTFHIVHLGNALDRMVDPMDIIDKAIVVTKPGGHIIIVGYENEVVRRRLKNGNQYGMHNWNLYIGDENCLFLQLKDGPVKNLTTTIRDRTEQVAHRLFSDRRDKKRMEVVFCKN